MLLWVATICLFLLHTYSLELIDNDAVQVATMRQRCKRHGYTVPVNVHGCYKTEVFVNTCIGACLSLHCPLVEETGKEHIALHAISNCCHVTEVVNVTLALKCENSSRSY